MTPVIKRAVIIGGGIGGLCAAIAMHRIGIDAVVYEQAPQLNAVGAVLVMWPNAIRALRYLGVADAVLEAGGRIERGEIRTSAGTPLSEWNFAALEQRFGEAAVPIHRADLQEILVSALPEGALYLNSRCTGVDGARVSFAGGRKESADLVVGVDGIHSTLRQWLFPTSALRYSGYSAWRAVVATQDKTALGQSAESWGCGSRFGMARIDEQRIYWFATANVPEGLSQTAAERKNFLRQRFGDWHSPIGHLLDATPADEILHNDIYDMAPLRCWSNERVVLLGDAAQPTTPNMGQGHAMAIESAVTLSRCLAEEISLSAALTRYESERMPRTAWIAGHSHRIGRIGQLENPLACALRNFFVKITPAKLTTNWLAKAFSYKV